MMLDPTILHQFVSITNWPFGGPTFFFLAALFLRNDDNIVEHSNFQIGHDQETAHET